MQTDRKKKIHNFGGRTEAKSSKATFRKLQEMNVITLHLFTVHLRYIYMH